MEIIWDELEQGISSPDNMEIFYSRLYEPIKNVISNSGLIGI
ncbi:hypothetical protein [Nitrosopumilus piranensis]|uniref:Uncharacterized protein n=1 Tax=Nitrosopumilus piranensis TaxID=1582439 RepID=A0A0C5BTZ2_9ARCH|nr:hypothetical protein [Nitrosopumilus piranensis]AJM91751.1 hypothetical protein NPIRD3C_0537 [Nitrosopumilus piranensis]